jgi:uncharacterized protein (TIGR03437 family)
VGQTAVLTASLNTPYYVIHGYSQTVAFSLVAGATANAKRAAAPLTLEGAAISCNPSYVTAQGSSFCDLRLQSPASSALNAPVFSTNPHVKVPATVSVRQGESRVRFEITADADAMQDTATLSVQSGDSTVDTSLPVLPSDAPALIAPTTETGTPDVPLRFGVRAVDGNQQPLPLVVSGLPSGAAFDAATGEFNWTPTRNDLGSYEIGFGATNSVGLTSAGTVKLSIESGLPRISGIRSASAASAPAVCAPGSAATLVGSFLSTEGAPGQVLINNEPATVIDSAPGAVSFLCPASKPGTALTIVIETPAGRSEPVSTTMEEVAPAILTVGGAARNQAMAFIGDALHLATIPNYEFGGHPAETGDTLSVRVAGIPCDNAGSTGAPLLKIGTNLLTIASIAPASDHPGTCEVTAVVPGGVSGDRVPLTLQALRSDGTPVLSNAPYIAVGF